MFASLLLWQVLWAESLLAPDTLFKTHATTNSESPEEKLLRELFNNDNQMTILRQRLGDRGYVAALLACTAFSIAANLSSALARVDNETLAPQSEVFQTNEKLKERYEGFRHSTAKLTPNAPDVVRAFRSRRNFEAGSPVGYEDANRNVGLALFTPEPLGGDTGNAFIESLTHLLNQLRSGYGEGEISEDLHLHELGTHHITVEHFINQQVIADNRMSTADVEAHKEHLEDMLIPAYRDIAERFSAQNDNIRIRFGTLAIGLDGTLMLLGTCEPDGFLDKLRMSLWAKHSQINSVLRGDDASRDALPFMRKERYDVIHVSLGRLLPNEDGLGLNISGERLERLKRVIADYNESSDQLVLELSLKEDLYVVKNPQAFVSKDSTYIRLSEYKAPVVVLGAGKIGRGLLGHLLGDGGYEVTLINSPSDLVEHLKKTKSYKVRVFSDSGMRSEIAVGVNDVLDVNEKESIQEIVCKADRVFMAVAPGAVESASHTLAGAINHRVERGITRPLDVYVVTNILYSEGMVRRYILDGVDRVNKEAVDGMLGVIDTVTFNIIPETRHEMVAEDPWVVGGSDSPKLIVNRASIKGMLPRIQGITLADNIKQVKRIKLYIYNGIHAICAYMGHIKGYEYVYESVMDPEIRNIVLDAFEEAREIFGDYEDYDGFIESALREFGEANLQDKVKRVARNPIRKLSIADRLVGTAQLIVRRGRMPNAFAIGIAAALLYDDPNDPDTKILDDMFLEHNVKDIVGRVCGLHPVNDATLIAAIERSLVVMRRTRARTRLRALEPPASHDPIEVSGRVPSGIKLMIWDFDDVIVDTRGHYAHATAITYWRIINQREGHEMPPSWNDGDYLEGKRLYYANLPGQATYHTIVKGIKSVRPAIVADKESLQAEIDRYYQQFARLRQDIANVSPETLIKPGVRDMMQMIRALDPGIEFCIATAGEQTLFNTLYPRTGLTGMFSETRALSKAEREGGVIERNKVRNIRRLIEARSLKEEEVLLVDDSAKILKLVSHEMSGVYRVGMVTYAGSGRGLVDAGADVLIKGMEPSSAKLKFMGIDARVVSDIQTPANGVYVVRASAADGDEDIEIETSVLTQLEVREPFVVGSEQERRVTEHLFEQLVKKGVIRPNVIANIKNFNPAGVSLYLGKLRDISEYYNGNITFVLVVEELGVHAHDMPSVFNAVAIAREHLAEDFDSNHTIVIADGGRKFRNMPLTLLYLYEGLMPFSTDRVRLQEVLIRSGGMLLQSPGAGFDRCIVVASDCIFKTEHLRPIAELPKDHLFAAVGAPRASRDEMIGAIARVAEEGKTAYVLAKPNEDRVNEYAEEYPSAREYHDLYFLTLWNKSRMGTFLEEMQRIKMSDDRSLINIPSDMYLSLLQSVFMEEEDWLTYRPKDIKEDDWKKIRMFAVRHVGWKGENVSFIESTQKDAVIDEGRLDRCLPRLKNDLLGADNSVKKDPDVLLGNAASARLVNVVIRGSGKIVFGENVHIRNSIFHLNSETLVVPDGWYISGSYIGGSCVFEGVDGYVISAVSQNPANGSLIPLVGEVFEGGQASTVVVTADDHEIAVKVPVKADRKAMEALSFQGRTLIDLQDTNNVLENYDRKRAMEDAIASEYVNRADVFPLNKAAVVEQETEHTDYGALIERLTQKVVGEHKKGHYWIALEGVQGSGKSYLLEGLRVSLEAKGKHVVMIEEDWFHKARKAREKARADLDSGRAEKWHEHLTNWHDWERAKMDLERIHTTPTGTIVLENLYNLNDEGSLTRTETLDVKEDTIFVYSGFYVSDIGKVDIPYDLFIYLGIDQDDSLRTKEKRDDWRGAEDIAKLDRDIYRPAFRRHIMTNDPALSADIVIRVDDIANRSAISIVKPLSALRVTKTHEESHRLGMRALGRIPAEAIEGYRILEAAM